MGLYSNGRPRREKKLFPNEVLQFKDLVHDSTNENLTSSLYLGERYHAKNKEVLEYHDVVYILNCTPPKDIDTTAGNNCYFEHENCFKYKRISVFDNVHQNILPFIDEAIAFIDEGKKYGSVFVHCNKGRSRSASFVIAYIMRKTNMNPEQAFQYLSSRRPCIQPNESFWNQLWFYYNFILNYNTEPNNYPSLEGPLYYGMVPVHGIIPISSLQPLTLSNEQVNINSNTTVDENVFLNQSNSTSNIHLPVQTLVNEHVQASHLHDLKLESSPQYGTHPLPYQTNPNAGSLLVMESIPLVSTLSNDGGK